MGMSKETAQRLQEILSKRFGRELSQEELETAYHALMEFAWALVDLDDSFQKKNESSINKQSVAFFPQPRV